MAVHAAEDWQKGDGFHGTVGENRTNDSSLPLVSPPPPIPADLSLCQLFIPAVATVACLPDNLPVFMLMCILMGFSVATMFLLPW